MYKLGDKVRGNDIGREKYRYYIWVECPRCHKQRWITAYWEKVYGHMPLCNHCSHSRMGKDNPHWKGGISRHIKGYIFVRLYPDDFFYPMAGKYGRVLEHRLVVAQALGRCLLPWEIVHHKGTKYPSGSKEDKGDNRYPENLELLSDKRWHLIDSVTKAYTQKQEKRIKLLEWQVKELNNQLRENETESEQIKARRKTNA